MSKTILVVDDEMLIALDIQTQLEGLGHKALIASALSEALALAESQQIDVAIVDWHLRDEISAPLIDLLRQRKIPFVVCSGSALEELASLFPSSPILIKPFAADDLVGVLGPLIDGGTVHLPSARTLPSAPVANRVSRA
jgi:CheY-like chemotaxis protein